MADVVIVTTSGTPRVTVRTGIGIKGDKGDPGSPGPPGSPGSAPQASEFPFTADMMVYDGTEFYVLTVPHNLGYRPNFIVVDSGDNIWEPIPHYPDINTLILKFRAPFGGTVILS